MKIYVNRKANGLTMCAYSGNDIVSIVFNTGAELSRADVPEAELKDMFFTMTFRDGSTATFNTKRYDLGFPENR